MNKKVMSAFLLFTLIGQVAAIPIAVVLFGVALTSGAAIGYFLGIRQDEDLQKVLDDLNQRVTESEMTNEISLRMMFDEVFTNDQNTIALYQDLLQYSRNYVWAKAKYEYIKTYKNTSSTTQAKVAAINAVTEYYDTLVRNIISYHNKSITYLMHGMPIYTGLSVNKKYIIAKGVPGGFDTYGNNIDEFNTTIGTVNCLGTTYSILKPYVHGRNGYYNQYHWYVPSAIFYSDEQDIVSDDQGVKVYDWALYNNLLTAIDSEYQTLSDNANTFFDSIEQTVLEQADVDSLIDPYVLASMMNTDLNTTGYYGYAAAELALAGLPTTGLNKTVTIDVNGTVLEGFLFSSNETVTYEVNKTYDPASDVVYIAADDGLYKITEPFTIVNMTSHDGKPVQNTTVIKYVSHTDNVSAILDDLQKVIDLYNEYLEMQAIAGGGASGGGFMDWWNGLDMTAKIGVIAIGGIAVYAILRRD
jgi:uncharacterized protein YneF (UPF0154 family)